MNIPHFKDVPTFLNLDNSTNPWAGKQPLHQSAFGTSATFGWRSSFFAGQLYFLAAAFRACVVVVVLLLLVVVVVVDSWQGFRR